MLLVLLVLLVLIALFVASCSSDDASGDIRFLVFGEPAELQAFRSVVSEFRKVEPEITVTLIEAVSYTHLTLPTTPYV